MVVVISKSILAVTGDTHGEERRFIHKSEPCFKHLHKGDYLFICGDFGYVFSGSDKEQKFMEYVADKLPFTICFCDGNHENFDLLNSYDVSVWNGGKVYIIKQNKAGEPKVIHLMRGKVYEMPLNGFLEYIREKAKYKHWFMGHLHRDEDVWRHQTILWFYLRNMEDNTEPM